MYDFTRIAAGATPGLAPSAPCSRINRVLIALILSGIAGSAAANTDSTAQIRITGTIPPKCGFTATPTNTVIPTIERNVVVDVGTLGFSCNLPSVPVNLTITSENGGLKRVGGSEVIPYEAAWDVQGRFEDFGPASAFMSGVGFTLNSGVSVTNQQGRYKVRVQGDPASYVAGTYEDTITYTISP